MVMETIELQYANIVQAFSGGDYLQAGLFTIFAIVVAIFAAFTAVDAKKKADAAKKKAEREERARRNRGQEVRFTNANLSINLCYGRTSNEATTVWADVKDVIKFAPNLYGDYVFGGFATTEGGNRLISGERDVEALSGKHAFMVTQDSICAAPINRFATVTVDGAPEYDPKFAGYMQISANIFGGKPHPVAIANDPIDPEEPDKITRATAKATGLAYATSIYQKNREDPQFSGPPKLRFFLEGRRVRGLFYNGTGIVGNQLGQTTNTPIEPDIDSLTAAREEVEDAIRVINFDKEQRARVARRKERCSTVGGKWTGSDRSTYKGIRGCREIPERGGGTCVPGDTFIQMATGDWKRIDEVLVGEKIQGRTQINTVLAYDRLFLKDHATPVLYEINKAYQNTDDHLTLLDTGWAVFNKCNYREYNGQVLDCVYDENLNRTPMLFKGFPEEEIREYSVGSNIAIGSRGSYTNINSIEAVRADEEQTIYSLVADGDGTMIVQGGYVLSAWADSDKWRGE